MRIQPDRFRERTLRGPGCFFALAPGLFRSAQIRVVGGGIRRRFLGEHFRFGAGEFGVERFGHHLCDLAFHSENIVEGAIVTFGPEMFVIRSANQLHIHVHGIGDFLHAALQ